MNWIKVTEKRPLLIEGKNYSENVLAVLDGQLVVMCYCWIEGDDEETTGYCWTNCYNDIHGDSYFDDDYNPTHWMPFPELPKL